MALASRAAFIHQNYADALLLEGGAWAGALPLANLQSHDINQLAQTDDATNAATQFQFDMGVARPIGGFAIGPTNATLGSTWRVRAFSDAGYTATVYDTGALTLPGSTGDSLDLEWVDPGLWYGIDVDEDQILPRYFYHVIPDASLAAVAASGQYWRYEFFDTGNVDGYMRYGRLWHGRAWRPNINYAKGGNGFGILNIGDVGESLGGQRFYWDRGQRRVWRAQFRAMTNAEAFANVGRMMKQLRNSRQFFVVPNPSDTVFGRLLSFPVTYKEVPEIEQVAYNLAATVFDFEEVL